MDTRSQVPYGWCKIYEHSREENLSVIGLVIGPSLRLCSNRRIKFNFHLNLTLRKLIIMFENQSAIDRPVFEEVFVKTDCWSVRNKSARVTGLFEKKKII